MRKLALGTDWFSLLLSESPFKLVTLCLQFGSLTLWHRVMSDAPCSSDGLRSLLHAGSVQGLSLVAKA